MPVCWYLILLLRHQSNRLDKARLQSCGRRQKRKKTMEAQEYRDHLRYNKLKLKKKKTLTCLYIWWLPVDEAFLPLHLLRKSKAWAYARVTKECCPSVNQHVTTLLEHDEDIDSWWESVVPSSSSSAEHQHITIPHATSPNNTHQHHTHQIHLMQWEQHPVSLSFHGSDYVSLFTISQTCST